MKKYYLGIVFLFILFIIPSKVNACSYSEQVRLQKLAGNVNFSYDYTETQYNMTFKITVSNLVNEIYMVDTSTGRTYYSNNEDFTIDGYKPGSTIKFNFYAKDSSCVNKTVFSNYVTLPAYNHFYKNKLCTGIENFSYCQKWLKHQMTYKQFYDGVIAYKNRPKAEIETPKKEIDWDIAIIEFWAKYYVFILLGIIILCGVVMYFYDKKNTL